MKKIAIILLIFATLSSCKNDNKEYNKTYDSWKTEMSQIKIGHTEALSILDNFDQIIYNHKKRLKEFTAFINTQTSKEIENSSKLEEDIVSEANINIKKHEHFMVFLNNLSALQGIFENKIFELYSISNLTPFPQFNSLNQATKFWLNEKNIINDDHNKALSIIKELKNHIYNHQKEIKEFTEKIEKYKIEKKAVSKLEDNYNLNKIKHDQFVLFLNNLKTVQQQFEEK
ncbi:MAG: hypothetical protein P8P27_01080 [Flavobacteriaceae bacterium]|nr:hypothetical protein [Flavobacteriaceae bacterium]